MRWLDRLQAYDETPRGSLTTLAEALFLLAIALAAIYWGLQLADHVLEGFRAASHDAREHMQHLHLNRQRHNPSLIYFLSLGLVSLVMIALGALGALIAPLWALSILKRMILPPKP